MGQKDGHNFRTVATSGEGVERGSGILEKHKRWCLFNLECFSFEKKMKQIGQNVDICETWVLAILRCSFPFI